MPSTDVSSTEKEVLSELEVDRLLAEVAQVQTQPAVAQAAPSLNLPPDEKVQAFDFRCPAFLTTHELRTFRKEHDEIVEALAARLGNYLRAELGLRVTEVQAVPYRRFVQSLAQPCHLTLFKVEPWRGICLLELNPRLGLAMSDRLMGGKGLAPAASRDLTQVEVALLDQAVQIMLSEWCAHWSKTQQLSPMVLGHENTAQFLRTSQADAVMITLLIEARLGECAELIQFGFPATTLEPLLQELRLKSNLNCEQAAANNPAARPKWKRDFDHIPVAVVARWSGMKMTARQLTRLAVGDVIPLPPEFSSRVRLCLANAPKFSGRLGTCEGHWAVEVTEILPT